MQSICVVGLGYIGLPSASLLATKGYQVHGVDVNASVVEALNKGNILIHEPSLDVMVKSAVASGRLTADLKPASADIFILAVPTPFNEGYVPNLDYIHAAAKSIAPFLKPGDLVILESTSPVSTTEKVCQWIKEERPELVLPGANSGSAEQIYVAHCPERVLPGRILEELVSNDRVVGGVDAASTQKAVAFYRTFVQGEVCATNARTAELVKLTENAFRDVNIAFANELSLICDELGINVWETIALANRHPRVDILQPGPGVGGHCIAVDPWFIVNSAPSTARLIRTAREVNDSKPKAVLDAIRSKLTRFTKPVVACLGVTFKANTDDLRESPSLRIVEELTVGKTAQVLVADPYIGELPGSLKGKAEFCGLDDAIDRADVIVLLVDHNEFKEVDRSRLLGKIVIDTRGIYAG